MTKEKTETGKEVKEETREEENTVVEVDQQQTDDDEDSMDIGREDVLDLVSVVSLTQGS